MHPNAHCNTLYDSQDIKATKMSINRGMNKENVVCVCIYMNISQPLKRTE